MTPLDKLASLHNAERFLRPGQTLLALLAAARVLTDLQAAQALNTARAALFKHVFARTG